MLSRCVGCCLSVYYGKRQNLYTAYKAKRFIERGFDACKVHEATCGDVSGTVSGIPEFLTFEREREKMMKRMKMMKMMMT